jgi:hypothetical protein
LGECRCCSRRRPTPPLLPAIGSCGLGVGPSRIRTPARPSRRSIGGQGLRGCQATRPSRECAKVRHSFCFYGDTAFDLDSHVIAVAEKKLSHILHCVGWIPHVSSPRLEKLSWINRKREASVQPANCNVAAHVRFTPKSGHCLTTVGCPLCAKSGLMQCSN